MGVDLESGAEGPPGAVYDKTEQSPEHVSHLNEPTQPSTFWAILIGVLVVLLSAIGTVSLVFVFGFDTIDGLHVLAVSVTLLVVLAALGVFRLAGSEPNSHTLVIYFFVAQLVIEAVVLLFVPAVSVIPLDLQAELGLSVSALDTSSPFYDECQYEYTRAEAARFYAGTLLDVDEDATLVIGGVPRHIGNVLAQGIFKTVYIGLPEELGCLDNETLVHELGHVLEFKLGLWFGADGPLKLFEWAEQQATNRSGMYSYGGENGLEHILDNGGGMQSLNFEQQSMILQSCYRSRVGRPTDAFGHELNDNYINLLNNFANQLLHYGRQRESYYDDVWYKCNRTSDDPYYHDY